MAMFANGEQYNDIGYSNFASQNNSPALMAAVARNNTTRVSDSFVGSPLSTGNLQPTSGHLGLTRGFGNATTIGKLLLAGVSIAVGMAMETKPVWRVSAAVGTFAVGSVIFNYIRGE